MIHIGRSVQQVSVAAWGLGLSFVVSAQSAAPPKTDNGTSVPQAVHNAVAGMADFLLDYAIALAAVGALVMALIEAAKTLLRIRDRYHERALRRFFGADPADQAGATGAFAELMHLATGSALAGAAGISAAGRLGERTVDNALFTMELERMMSPIQDSVDTALNYPRMYPALFSFFSAGADPADIAAWIEAAEHRGTAPEDDAARQLAIDAYGRISKLARRRLDGFQLATGFRWREGNQRWAYGLGFVVLFASLSFADSFGTARVDWSCWQIASASLIGGIVAPVAKDLMVALKRVRGGG